MTSIENDTPTPLGTLSEDLEKSFHEALPSIKRAKKLRRRECLTALWRFARLDGVPVELVAFDPGRWVPDGERAKIRSNMAVTYVMSADAADKMVRLGGDQDPSTADPNKTPITTLWSSGYYIVPAALTDGVEARYPHGVWNPGESMAAEKDVMSCRILSFDCDPARPKKTNSTTAQFFSSLAVGWQVRDVLVGAGAPINSLAFGQSGNGCQVLLATDMPWSEEVKLLRKRLLAAMGALVDVIDEQGRPFVTVDQAMADGARYIPAFGTWKAKGPNHGERVRRRTCLDAPEKPEGLTFDALRAVTQMVESAIPENRKGYWRTLQSAGAGKRSQPSVSLVQTNELPPLDICNAVSVSKVYALLGGDPTKPECPFCGATTGIDCLEKKDLNIIKCQHATCGAKAWGSVSLVAKLAFGLDDLKGDKEGVKKVIGWFTDKGLVDLPARRSKPKRATKLRLVQALESVAVTDGEGDDEQVREVYHPTEEGNAQRLVDRFGDEIRYVPKWGKWLAWTGTHWTHDDDQVRICELARKVVQGLHDQAAALADDNKEAFEALKAWAFASESAKAQRNMITLARSIPAIVVEPTMIDADPWLLNVRNGTLDLRTGELKPHDPKDLIDRVAPVEWHGFDAPAPTWDAFLERVHPDVEIRRYLDRRWGYGLTGVTREHLFGIDLGKGANGKGTAHNTVLRMMGPYGAVVPMSLLAAKRADAHPVDRMTLFRVRYAVAAEPEEGLKLDTATVKNLTGGDIITARGMRENFTEFEPSHTFCVHANFRPRISALDPAIWRRVQLVPWDVIIPEDEQEDDLSERLLAEAPGILARLVKGCLEWQKLGLAPPEKVLVATAEYRQSEDWLGEWVDEHCVIEEGASVVWSSLWERYETTAGKYPVSRKRFQDALTAKGFGSQKQGKGHTTYRVGLRLGVLPEDDEDDFDNYFDNDDV